jgi:hypothetical protein
MSRKSHRIIRTLPRRGIGRVDLLVCLAGAMCFAVLLFPALMLSREHARGSQCRQNLKTIGISMHTFATIDPEERFLTGAPSFELDGCPDTYGWPADMAAIKTGRADELMCPSNRIRGTEWLGQVLTGDEARVPESRRGKGFCASLSPLSVPPSASQVETRVRAVEGALLRQGGNTNYAGSWFAARGQVEWTKEPRRGGPNIVQAGPYREIAGNVEGPLRRRTIDRSDLPSNIIPMLGDGAPVFASAVPLGAALEWSRSRLPEGASLAASFGGGPAFVPTRSAGLSPAIEESDGEAILLPQYPNMGDEVAFSGVADWLSTISYGTLGPRFVAQDTRHWRVTHGVTANLLMADGSTRVLTDINGDGYFNPGFPLPPDLDKAKIDTEHGYRSGVVEINWLEVFSGVRLVSDRDLGGCVF